MPSTAMSSYRNVFNLWLAYVSGMVCFGWLLSAVDGYRWMGAAGLLLVCLLSYLFVQTWREIPSKDRKSLAGDLKFPPFLILFGLITLAGCLYTTSVLDSLSYRIPRMLMWLQEGRIHYVENPDFRMNFMTPVWEFATTPVYQASGFRFLWLGSGISWMLLYLAFVFLSRKLGADPEKARWLAIIPSASVGFVLQAASTMNDIWASSFVVISLAFIVAFEETPNFRDLVSSGIALSLAAGAKPHFAVFALPWIIWLVCSKNRPFRMVQWKWSLPVLALALACSPLITFFSNHQHYGSLKGPAGEGGFGLGGPWVNMSLGSCMMLWQLVQPPLNPLARSLEAWNKSWIETSGLHEVAPRFKLICREIAMVDGASLGMIASLVLVIGLLLVLIRKPRPPRWIWFAALAGFGGYLIAVSQVVPGTLGRSFIGFTTLGMPACLAGLSHFSRKWIATAASVTVLVSAVGLAFSPSHPLWPAKTLAAAQPRVAHHLSKYLEYQQRAVAGKSLIQDLPAGVTEIGVLSMDDQSLIHLWGDRERPLKVRFYPQSITLEEIHRNGPEFNVVIGNAEPEIDREYARIARQLASDERFSKVAVEKFTSKVDRGPEPWLVFRRRE